MSLGNKIPFSLLSVFGFINKDDVDSQNNLWIVSFHFAYNGVYLIFELSIPWLWGRIHKIFECVVELIKKIL